MEEVVIRNIMNYFLFICAGVNVLNLGILMQKMKNNKKQSIIGFVFIMIVPFIVLGILQQLGGYNNPFYIISKGIEVFKVIGWLLILALITIVFYLNNFVKGFNWTLYDSKDRIYIGEHNIFINLALLLFVVMTTSLLLSDVYDEFELIFERVYQSI